MILDEPESHFVFVYHPGIFHGEKYTVFDGRPLTNAEVLAFWGKWLVLGGPERLAELARKLDPFVEARMIPCIKYDRNPSGNLGMEECVMMVYCDRRNRDSVWAILKRQGIKLKAWVTEAETMELWKPGGPLLERWMDSRGFDEEMKKLIRADAEKRLSRIRDNPDEEFSPWEQ